MIVKWTLAIVTMLMVYMMMLTAIAAASAATFAELTCQIAI